MQQHHFVKPAGPLGAHADEYRVHLEAVGYRFAVVQRRLTQFGELSSWLEADGVTVAELDEAEVLHFTATRSARGLKTLTTPGSFGVPLSFFRAVGAVTLLHRCGFHSQGLPITTRCSFAATPRAPDWRFATSRSKGRQGSPGGLPGGHTRRVAAQNFAPVSGSERRGSNARQSWRRPLAGRTGPPNLLRIPTVERYRGGDVGDGDVAAEQPEAGQR